jgi:asparagine synthase (glutamine-hydrolysing)
MSVIREHQTSKPVGLLFSGGLDSSIIAKIMLSVFSQSDIVAVSVGLSKSHDLLNASSRAKELGLKLEKCVLTEKLVLDVIQHIKEKKIVNNPGDLGIAIPLFVGMKTLANKFNVQTVFLGQGADENFAGYRKYVELYEMYGPDVIKKAMTNDLQQLQNKQKLMEERIARTFQIKLVYPFLDPQIVNFAFSQPITTHIVRTIQGDFIRKALLRTQAEKLGLSRKITTQPKKAMQYGSGTVKLLRKLAKSSGHKNISEWFKAFFLNSG